MIYHVTYTIDTPGGRRLRRLPLYRTHAPTAEHAERLIRRSYRATLNTRANRAQAGSVRVLAVEVARLGWY